LRLLLDEMYPATLAEALREASVDACTASELGLVGSADLDLFTAAIAQGRTVLTENVADFARVAAEHLIAGRHHPGVLIALSSRFSRRPAGVSALVAATLTVAAEQVGDRIVYLERADPA
jgi:predicted nuclease of predicted toxin-antitoxin system